MLPGTATYRVKNEDGTETMKEVSWAPDHKFVIGVPAWVFREAKKLMGDQ